MTCARSGISPPSLGTGQEKETVSWALYPVAWILEKGNRQGRIRPPRARSEKDGQERKLSGVLGIILESCSRSGPSVRFSNGRYHARVADATAIPTRVYTNNLQLPGSGAHWILGEIGRLLCRWLRWVGTARSTKVDRFRQLAPSAPFARNKPPSPPGYRYQNQVFIWYCAIDTPSHYRQFTSQGF